MKFAIRGFLWKVASAGREELAGQAAGVRRRAAEVGRPIEASGDGLRIAAAGEEDGEAAEEEDLFHHALRG
jgi:hypothetical protein